MSEIIAAGPRRGLDVGRTGGVGNAGRLGYGNHFRLRDPADVDEALGGLVREAYAIGRQAHLQSPPAPARP
jgi:hypothetical protein